jgi:glycerophosphoryl diester phosphodiesterase
MERTACDRGRELALQIERRVRAAATAHPDAAAYFRTFDVSAHRGGRGLRPENTLPSFENGLDHLVTTLETDTGVTTDHVSLIWHDQFLSPESCRRVDGTPYTLENRVYTRDISLAEAQSTFICDKLHPQFPEQKNDLALSPVSVAFAKQEHLINPYVPTDAEQLFRFSRFYADYYRTGPGKSTPTPGPRRQRLRPLQPRNQNPSLPQRPGGKSVETSPPSEHAECAPTTPTTRKPSSPLSTEPSPATK